MYLPSTIANDFTIKRCLFVSKTNLGILSTTLLYCIMAMSRGGNLIDFSKEKKSNRIDIRYYIPWDLIEIRNRIRFSEIEL